MKEKLKWIMLIYEANVVEAFFLYLYFTFRRWTDTKPGILEETDTLHFDHL